MKKRQTVSQDDVMRAASQLRANLSRKGLGEWSWLLGHLAGRFVASRLNGGTVKGLQLLLTSAASLVAWIQSDPAVRSTTTKPKGKQ